MVSEQAPIQLGAWAVRCPAASRLPGLAAPGSVSGRGCYPVNAFRGDAAIRLFIVMDLLLTCGGFECCIDVGRASRVHLAQGAWAPRLRRTGWPSGGVRCVSKFFAASAALILIITRGGTATISVCCAVILRIAPSRATGPPPAPP